MKKFMKNLLKGTSIAFFTFIALGCIVQDNTPLGVLLIVTAFSFTDRFGSLMKRVGMELAPKARKILSILLVVVSLVWFISFVGANSDEGKIAVSDSGGKDAELKSVLTKIFESFYNIYRLTECDNYVRYFVLHFNNGYISIVNRTISGMKKSYSDMI